MPEQPWPSLGEKLSLPLQTFFCRQHLYISSLGPPCFPQEKSSSFQPVIGNSRLRKRAQKPHHTVCRFSLNLPFLYGTLSLPLAVLGAWQKSWSGSTFSGSKLPLFCFELGRNSSLALQTGRRHLKVPYRLFFFHLKACFFLHIYFHRIFKGCTLFIVTIKYWLCSLCSIIDSCNLPYTNSLYLPL